MDLSDTDLLTADKIGEYVFFATFMSNMNNGHLNGIFSDGNDDYVMLTTTIDYLCIDNALVIDGYEAGQEFQFAITDSSEALVITVPGVVDQRSLDAGNDTPTECGLITREVTVRNVDTYNLLSIPYMVFDDSAMTITIDTSDDSMRATYDIVVTYTLEDH